MKRASITLALLVAGGFNSARGQVADAPHRLGFEVLGGMCCGPEAADKNRSFTSEDRSGKGFGAAMRYRVKGPIAVRLDGFSLARFTRYDGRTPDAGWYTSTYRDRILISTLSVDAGVHIWRSLDASFIAGAGILDAHSVHDYSAVPPVGSGVVTLPAIHIYAEGLEPSHGTNAVGTLGARLAYGHAIAGIQYFIPKQGYGGMASPHETALITIGARW
jgi:hypothetical protein